MTRNCSFIIVFTFVLFFLAHGSFSFDYYQACKPEICGELTIRYPFYTSQQHAICGYQGFQVSCFSKNRVIFNLSNDEYVIKNISYEDQTFNLANTEFICVLNCNLASHNLTLQGTNFQYALNYTTAYLLEDCSEEAKKNIVQYTEMTCIKNKTQDILATYADNITLSEVVGKCSRIVLVAYATEDYGDIRSDMRNGFTLRWNVSNCPDSCFESNGRCGYNRTNSQVQCFCPDGPRPDRCPPIVGSIVGMSILTSLLTYLLRKKSTEEFSGLWSRGKTDNQNVETFLKAYSTLAVKRYTYADIRKMTNSFKDKLGEGGYGSVYKGRFHDGRFVAVKLLKHLKTDGEDFINEVASISRTNHVNIITLLGFCFEGKRRALIYDFLSKGSLDKYMYDAAGGQSLSLEIQFNIAVGIARGLDYLHRGCNTRILHFDIKPHNILLDDGFCPKISDFGLAKLVCLSKDSTVSMVEARGTIGYIAPEVFLRNFGGVSHKSDVYSYGMMVLDMVCGRKSKSDVVQSSSTLYFPDWIYNQLEVGAEVSVHEIGNDEEKRLLQRKMIIVSLWCIQMYPSKRPSMSRVVEMLEGCLESLEMPPKPDASSSQRLAFDFSTSQITTTQLLI